jgi:multicomponent Na+:H+ antiporter subunit E
MGAGADHLLVGAVVAMGATWLSLRLLPPSSQRVRLMRLPGFVLRFCWQSVAAGWDIARRAFDPRLPIRPGFVVYPVGLPPGPMRNVFTTVTSLVPGTVPAGDDDAGLVYHCLDVEQPVARQLAVEEAVLRRVLHGGAGRG